MCLIERKNSIVSCYQLEARVGIRQYYCRLDWIFLRSFLHNSGMVLQGQRMHYYIIIIICMLVGGCGCRRMLVIGVAPSW
jgi:hypothetical protein